MNRNAIHFKFNGRHHSVTRKALRTAAAAQGLEWNLEDLALEMLQGLDTRYEIEQYEIEDLAIALYEIARNLD